MNMYGEHCAIYINKQSGYQSLSYVEGPVNIIGGRNCNQINAFQGPYPPIIRAAMNVHDNHELVKTLIEFGANVNATDYEDATALHRAALWHRMKIIEVLLELGADVHRTNWRGNTALHSAAFSWVRNRSSLNYENDLLVMKALLRKKPDVNARNEQGNTPLMEAVQGFHLDIVKELLKAGADVRARNKSGETCLHLLFNSTGKTDIMTELIKAGAPLQAVDRDGRTPLKKLLLQGMDEELMEDIKALIKTALLVDSEVKEDYYVNQEINNFADECHAEVQRMKTFQFSGRLILCDFALRRGVKSERFVDSVYEVIMKNTFKIYDDYITAYFERKYLCSKVVEKGIYTTKDPYDIVLPKDLIEEICNFLSKTDLLNLLRGLST